MESLDYWRLCEKYSIPDTAILIIGYDPSYDNGYDAAGYKAVYTALKQAAKLGKIQTDVNVDYLQQNNDIDWYDILIEADEIKRWLVSKGIRTGFFFPEKQNNLPYMDKNSPYYATKLAVAIMAWEEVTNNPYLLKNKSPKKAIEAWLETNASKFNLSTQAVGEIDKIANWNTKGGAPSTPLIETDINTLEQDFSTKEEVQELEDEIPF